MASDATSTEARLRQLEDIEAIRQLKARYCQACDDDHDPDAVADLFVDDGVWEASISGRFEGRAAIHGYFAAVRATGRMRHSAHNVFNPVIEVDGDEASGHWRLLMLYTVETAGGDVEHFRIIGCYRDRYRRLQGQWRFSELYCQVDEHGAYPATDTLG